MASLFDKDPTLRPQLSNYERIAAEITHLKKGTSVRHGSAGKAKSSAPWAIGVAVCAVLGLFFMDPFLYSMHKSDAIHTYVYLHNYDSATATTALTGSGIFSSDEIAAMDRRHGSFQDTFSSPQAAEKKAADIVSYMNGLRAMRAGKYEELDEIGKLRYLLFVRAGLFPPVSWSSLNPKVE